MVIRIGIKVYDVKFCQDHFPPIMPISSPKVSLYLFKLCEASYKISLFLLDPARVDKDKINSYQRVICRRIYTVTGQSHKEPYLLLFLSECCKASCMHSQSLPQ